MVGLWYELRVAELYAQTNPLGLANFASFSKLTLFWPQLVPDSYFSFSELFRKTIIVPFISLPEDKLNKIQKKFKDNFFKVPNMKPIQNIENSSRKRILLDPMKIKTYADISEKDRNYLESVIDVEESDFGEISVVLSVDNFRPQVMLKAVLPTGEVEGD